MLPSESFRYKSQEELRSQFQSAQDIVGNEEELSFTPPSRDQDEIFSLSVSEIKQKYARRYEMYFQILRRKKTEGNFTEGEVEYFRKWLFALNALDTYITNHHEGEEVTLRERQVTVFEDLRNFVEAGGREGYIKLPTGVGKTVLFTEFVEALSLRALIVVPKKLLVRQTEGKFKKFAPDLDVGKIYADAKQFGRQVTIITYDSLRNQLEKGTIKPEDYDCLILDEAHVSLSDKRMDVVKKFTQSLNIGFTATPDYSDEKGVSQLLATEIHHMNIKEAVQEKLLSPFTSILARTKVDISNVKVTSSGEYDESELEEAVNVFGRNKAAVDLYKQGFNGQLAVAYCAGVQHAKDLAKLFNEEGIPAAAISGKTPDKEQEKLIEQFHNGEIKVLCNADILIAGFDEQRASVCLNLKPTRSRVVAEQRGGRVLRLDEDDSRKHAYIIDFIDQRVPETNLPILFANVVGEAQILSSVTESWGTGGGGGKTSDGTPQLPDIQVEGLEVITETEEIMKVVSSRLESEVEKNYLSLEELKNELRVLGINKQKDYQRVAKTKSSWPSTPNVFYKNSGWISWIDLFDREKVIYLSLEDLKAELKKFSITKARKYKEERPVHPRWPANPDTYYANKGWISWVDLFGQEKKISLEELKREIKIFGVTTKQKYEEVSKSKPSWPSSPREFYGKDWLGWSDLFGRI